MDSLSMVLQFVRDELQRVGSAAPAANDDAIASALANAELKARRVLGGAKHYVRRDAKIDTLRLISTFPDHMTPQQIAERTGYSERHVQQMRALLKDQQRSF